ncbi:MAG: sensor histidine kinase [Nonlabens sp.]
MLKTLEEKDQILDLLRLSFYYAGIDNDSAISYVNKAERISLKYKDTLNLIRTYRIKGVAFYESNSKDSMLYYYHKGSKLAKFSNENLQYAHFKNNMGNYYLNIGSFEIAIENFLDAKKVYDIMPDLYDRGMVANNLSLTYLDLNEYNKALAYGKESLSIREEIKDSVDIANSLSNLSTIQNYLKNPESARNYALRGIQIAKKINDKRHLPNLYNALALSYRFLEDCDASIRTYKKALEFSDEMENAVYTAETYNSLAYVYEECNDLDQSQKYSQLALKMGDSLSLQYVKTEAHYLLGRIQIRKGNITDGLDNLDKWKSSFSTLYDENKNERIAESEVTYKVESYKRKIELEKQKKEKQILYNRILWLSILGLIIIISLAGFAFYQSNKRKYEKALAAEKDKSFKSIIFAEENERQRIARELHDGIVQQLCATIIKSRKIFKDSNLPKADSQDILIDLKNISEELRDLSHQMMPRALEEGLIIALEDLLESTLGILGIEYDFENKNIDESLPRNVEITLYRITQELINNIIKHSRASFIQIQLFQMNDNLILMVEDNGIGLKNKGHKGIGLTNIKTRLNLIQGVVKFNTLEPGLLATIKIPLSND